MRTTLLLLITVILSACGGAGADDDRPDADAPEPDPDFDDTAARIDLGLGVFSDGSGGYLTITGRLYDTPPPWPYDVEAPVDGCRYSTRLPMTCAACDVDQVCVDGACVDSPVGRSAGTLTIRGGAVTRTVPYADTTYQHYEPSQPFAADVELTVSAPGDDLAAFSLAAASPAPLVLVERDLLRLQVGAPLVVRWTPADPGSRIRLTLGADLGHAQHRAALIECDVPDELGAIAVPQSMVDRFADDANWTCGECFPHEVRRYRRARGTAGALPLTLWVNQTESLYLRPEP